MKRKNKNKEVLDKSIEKTTDTDKPDNENIKPGKRKKKLVIILSAIISVPLLIVLLIIYTNPFRSSPKNLTITIAWNQGSITDDIARVFAREMDTSVILHNLTGANGATGANDVFRSPHNGGKILSTSLSAFVTSEAMGFAESSPNDWEVWLCAFAPAVLVVPSESPYHTFNALLDAIQTYPGVLRCADDGYGTINFIAAELLSSKMVLEVNHRSFSGAAQVIDAFSEYEADFAILLSVQAAEYVQSGRLRALGVFSEEAVTLNGDTEFIIPPLKGYSDRFDATLPFGEYYGFFIPKNTPGSQLSGLDTVINNALDSDNFKDYMNISGLTTVASDRSKSSGIINRFSSLANWTLFDAGFLPTDPDTLGIPRP